MFARNRVETLITTLCFPLRTSIKRRSARWIVALTIKSALARKQKLQITLEQILVKQMNSWLDEIMQQTLKWVKRSWAVECPMNCDSRYLDCTRAPFSSHTQNLTWTSSCLFFVVSFKLSSNINTKLSSETWYINCFLMNGAKPYFARYAVLSSPHENVSATSLPENIIEKSDPIPLLLWYESKKSKAPQLLKCHFH